MMNEENDFVKRVLHKVRKDPLSADLQISLFMAALQNYRHDSLLRPFPPGYFYENGEKNSDALREAACQIPSVEELNKDKNLPLDTWKLLDWIINLKAMDIKKTHTESKFNEITKKTENSRNFHMPAYIFEIKYSESMELKFTELCQDMKILFGYHGSRLENFYSIVHNGLHAHLNKTSLFGEGTYLSSDVNVSILYSKFGEGWKNSLLGNKLSCVAVCEIIDHPDVKRSMEGSGGRKSRARADNSEGGDVPERYFVVTNNQLVRVRYLMVYVSSTGYKMSFFRTLWIFQHPFASLVIIYILCLIFVGFSRTEMFQQLFKKLKS